LSEEFEESTITMCHSLSWCDKVIKFVENGSLDMGLGFKERFSSNKSGLDDGSAVINHSKDHVIFLL